MDPEMERFLDKIWARLNVLQALTNDRWKLCGEIYEMYHGGDLPGPKDTSIPQAQYDAEIEKLKSAGLAYQKDTHDHVFAWMNDLASYEEWRVYLNIPARNMFNVASRIARAFGKDATQFKVPRRAEDCDHFFDAVVIYTVDEARALLMAVALSRSPVKDLLQTNTPEGTKQIAPGIGIGNSPRDRKVSFGKLRAHAIAKAVIAFFTAPREANPGKIDEREYFSFLVQLACEQAGLDPQNTYKNSAFHPPRFSEEAFYNKPLLDVIKDIHVKRANASL